MILKKEQIFSVNEMKQMAQMLAKEWNLGKAQSGAVGNICGWIYLMDILKVTERMVILKDGERLMGFCGYSNIHSHKNFLKKKFYAFIEKCSFLVRKSRTRKH